MGWSLVEDSRDIVQVSYIFGMRNSTPNEIVFIESGLSELKAEIYKRQYDFWGKVLQNINDDPLAEVSKALMKGNENNVQYIRYYKKIDNDFGRAQHCYNFHKENFANKIKENIAEKTGVHSYRRTGIRIDALINPLLVSPDFYKKYILRTSTAYQIQVRLSFAKNQHGILSAISE